MLNHPLTILRQCSTSTSPWEKGGWARRPRRAPQFRFPHLSQHFNSFSEKRKPDVFCHLWGVCLPRHRGLWFGDGGVLQLLGSTVDLRLAERLVPHKNFWRVICANLSSVKKLRSDFSFTLSAITSRSRVKNHQLPARKAIRDAAVAKETYRTEQPATRSGSHH